MELLIVFFTNPIVLEFLLNITPLVAGAILGLSYVFQIQHLYKTKRADGISVVFWVVLSIALFLLFVNALTIFIMYGTWGYLVAEIFNLGLALVVLFMVRYYKGKNSK